MSGKDELAVTYAALILHDDGHAVTADKLDKLVKAAGVEVAPYWGMLFERVLKERNLDDLILNGGGAPAAAPAAAAPTEAPKEEKKEKKEEKPKSEDEAIGAFGLFDD
eukprot:TRINITY_DN13418_c0_g1_i1.p1 TRINITY_DN13418_c0_g1~~TRINITY_DN13418_c0_g1_i1.p1  ORF type:complete len:108 (-),score=50.17 TRINITY_DN13418_c0_g1_i1:78-401(-)